MKTSLVQGVVGLIMLAGLALAAPRDAQWARVADDISKGLPKSAATDLDPIIQQTLAEKAYPEAVKAVLWKISLQAEIEGNRPDEGIKRLQAQIATSPTEMRPVMEAVLGYWYWQYFEQNRWRFLQRTQAGTASGPDIQTWDLARILTEIDAHFSSALANDAVLKGTPISSYDALLTKGTVPDRYRPTLYDFVVHFALEFYQAGEQGRFASEDQFEIDAESPIFAEANQFERWQPATDDHAWSPQLKAIRLYQALLKFHHGDADPAAYDDADLARLTFAHNVAVGETKDDRYKAALEGFIERTSRYEISARAFADLAEATRTDGDFIKAHELADRGARDFPGSAGSSMCLNVISEIEAKSAQLETERIWNAPWPTLDITYRNTNRVYFRAYPVRFEDSLTEAGQYPMSGDVTDRLLSQKPILEWQSNLPATTDYKERTERLPAPTTLKPGLYVIIASHDAKFSTDNNQISSARIWVSDLALIIGSHGEGMVLNAVTGEPVADATVRMWRRDNNGRFNRNATSTDENGHFAFEAPNTPVLILAEYDGHAISSANESYWFRRDREDATGNAIVFFTDRALYRPGQTIYYKGIAIHGEHAAQKYNVRPDHEVTVVFREVNGNEIARATHRTNAYGSFSGSFVAPRDRLMGQMNIMALNETGNSWFAVEEYKRPKFHVDLSAPAESPKLRTKIDMSGHAIAYTGSAIGNAKVKWQVTRTATLPLWCWWRQPPSIKSIAHGTSTTDALGTFNLQFIADPDSTIPVVNEPVFSYTIDVDVTDGNGETRSEKKVIRVGYAALTTSIVADEWQTANQPVVLKIATQSLNDDPQAAQGNIAIHRVEQPSKVIRAPLQSNRRWQNKNNQPDTDPSNPETWPEREMVVERPFQTGTNGKAEVSMPLPVGIYRVVATTTDRFGGKATARQTIEVSDPSDRQYRIKQPAHLTAQSWSVEPGQTFTALWGTGYDKGRAFVEIEREGTSVRSFWTDGSRTQSLIQQKVSEDMRGGFTVRVTYVRENRAYTFQQVVDVPWSNKQLHVSWETFRSKLVPGQKETWTAKITGPNAKPAVAEFVAAMYDGSLDQFRPHSWTNIASGFRFERGQEMSTFQNAEIYFFPHHEWLPPGGHVVAWEYRGLPSARPEASGGGEVVALSQFNVSSGTLGSAKALMSRGGTMPAPAAMKLVSANGDLAPQGATENKSSPSAPDLSKIKARTNLNETAFFFPHLVSDADGAVKIVFTVPEALTEWKFIGFAHDADLRSGFLTGTAITSKDIMVEANPPRFLREGDAVEFTVKVSNQSDTTQTGSVRLTFNRLVSDAAADASLGNLKPEQSFSVPAKQSRTYSWRISVPDDIGFLTYKAVAASASFSDGEEAPLPVLSKRILVTESLPLPIRGAGTKQFEFEKLVQSGGSTTLRHQSLTVQMTSQPAWYAVMSLPYLMEYPYECSEQVFNRLYANALARHIANSDPKIHRVFEAWKATPTLKSPLEQNADLRSVALEETPWVRQAKSETESRRNLGLLFEDNRLDSEMNRTAQALAERQTSDGLWSWFPGGRPSEYISLYIMTGFGRMRNLAVKADLTAAIKSLRALDRWMADEYRNIQKRSKPGEYIPTSIDALYLYGRSFYLQDEPIAPEQRAAVDFFLNQARRYWVQIESRQSQAHLALAFLRFGDANAAQAIARSLRERSVSSDELGMFWRDTENNWWWHHAPIETQAMMIEVFAEVAHDTDAVDACQVWLLKQKQTQDWRTTKATADAIYALLLRGSNLLASDALVQVSLGGQRIEPENAEAGTGFYEKRFAGTEVKSEMGHVATTKTDAGVSWGAVHWQYLEDISKITPHEGTPLQLKKSLYLKETTSKGPVLKPVTGPVAVGDELVVRIELRSDRDMEFVHLKDQRGSGTEPVNVLSHYRYQDGLAYYESTRDTATHFFIDYLPKGTYVFEYSVRVQLKGRYESGLAEIQCMYAPEFNSHSSSATLDVR